MSAASVQVQVPPPVPLWHQPLVWQLWTVVAVAVQQKTVEPELVEPELQAHQQHLWLKAPMATLLLLKMQQQQWQEKGHKSRLFRMLLPRLHICNSVHVQGCLYVDPQLHAFGDGVQVVSALL